MLDFWVGVGLSVAFRNRSALIRISGKSFGHCNTSGNHGIIPLNADEILVSAGHISMPRFSSF